MSLRARILENLGWSFAVLLSFGFSIYMLWQGNALRAEGPNPVSGIEFRCQPNEIKAIENELADYFSNLNIKPEHYSKFISKDQSRMVYTLTTPESDTSTLDFYLRPEYEIADEISLIPSRRREGRLGGVRVASRKEIVLALMQHGRLTSFEKKACSAAALKDHVNLRQHIVAYASDMEWGWPEGAPETWNKKFWQAPGIPKNPNDLYSAFLDTDLNQKEYGIYCLTGTKTVLIRGVLDYYHRVQANPKLAMEIEHRLMAVDGDPLSGVGPYHEPMHDSPIPGKIAKRIENLPPRNFVPGDWAYLENQDSESHKTLGYEGSNVIYLGRNKLHDLYGTHGHQIEFEEKVEEIYQWRFEITARDRSSLQGMATWKPLSFEQSRKLIDSLPSGVVADVRKVPYFFGFEDLPELPKAEHLVNHSLSQNNSVKKSQMHIQNSSASSVTQ